MSKPDPQTTRQWIHRAVCLILAIITVIALHAL